MKTHLVHAIVCLVLTAGECHAFSRCAKKVVDPLSHYLLLIGQVPLLTREEEIDLLRQVASAREDRVLLLSPDLTTAQKRMLEEKIAPAMRARDLLIRANLRFAVYL